MSKKAKLATVVLLLLAGLAAWQASRPRSTRATVALAVEAYLYAYPLVTLDMVRRQETNTRQPTDERAPMGQWIKMRSYPPVDSHAAAAPNADTLYTMVWLDVSKEPAVLGIPAMGERYYIVPMLDAFSEVMHVASPSTAGTDAQTYVVTGPGYKGELPEGLTEVKSPTSTVWVLGRIYCTGTAEDYAAVHALQDKFTATPLSQYGKAYTPPQGVIEADLDMKTAVRKQVNALGVEEYFRYVARLLVNNPPHEKDAALSAKLASLGIEAGKNFELEAFNSADRLALKAVPKIALAKMALRLKEAPTHKGWLYFTEGVGNFGTDYELRGMANLLGPGWNRPEDAVYPLTQKDADGNAYDGAKHAYVMHFEKGQLPPVDAFWSLTLYDTDFFFVKNSANRYAISQRDELVRNPDGSIDVYIQADSPGPNQEANWLPAPKSEFYLVLRLYGPPAKPPTILDGSWKPPAVTIVP